MGKKDKASWNYFQDEARVADIINMSCYGGKKTVKPEDVGDADSRNKNGERDLIRKTALGTRYALIGIENQETVDYSLPVRIMGYDYGDYKRQVDKIKRRNRKRSVDPYVKKSAEYIYDYKKTDRIFPVVTIVFYYGDKKQVFKFIRSRKDRDKMKEIIENDPYYRNVEKSAHDMMKVYGGLRGYNIKEDDYVSDEGGINMCKAWDDWREEGKEEGIKEGRA